MKRLLLLRHAKAEPGGAGIEDHERELTMRGLHDAAAMGRFMERKHYLAGAVYCSAARRTRQTAELVLGEWRTPAPVEYREAFYLADVKILVAAIQAAPDVPSLMIVGHNPGIEKCAGLLAREPVKAKERDALGVLEEKFPTAALAVLDFDVGAWRQVAAGGGVLTEFARPRDL
jgi:phosphohistidine phosphatase